ncbi:MAG: flagellar basal body P-ring protein FlgI, partial [Woeseiaceae bacterium]|nr:flagellar basal body P-ring protein FlgI [Woeseiaceae bacterium]
MKATRIPGPSRATLALIVTALLVSAFGARAERVKDIAAIAGVRSNQLVGYGLVVGLDG